MFKQITLPQSFNNLSGNYPYILGFDVDQIFKAAIVFIVAFVFLNLIKMFFLNHIGKLSKKTLTNIDDAFVQSIKSLHSSFYLFLSLYVALQFITMPAFTRNILNVFLLIAILIQLVQVVQNSISFIIERLVKKQDKSKKAMFHIVGLVAKYFLWGVAVLLIISNLGFNISSLIAGLGIGGIAIALAIQNILGDLFSAFAIYLDKPFQPGDFIVVGDHKGTVQKIGIKSTRIKSLQGEEIIISNKELTSFSIRNFKNMENRRVSFVLNVSYETNTDQLKSIGETVRNIIEPMDGLRFSRIHLTNFSDSSLDFEVVYYVLSSDFDRYINAHQDILLQIKERFEQQGINFAYPTQTLYVHQNKLKT